MIKKHTFQQLWHRADQRKYRVVIICSLILIFESGAVAVHLYTLKLQVHQWEIEIFLTEKNDSWEVPCRLQLVNVTMIVRVSCHWILTGQIKVVVASSNSKYLQLWILIKRLFRIFVTPLRLPWQKEVERLWKNIKTFSRPMSFANETANWYGNINMVSLFQFHSFLWIFIPFVCAFIILLFPLRPMRAVSVILSLVVYNTASARQRTFLIVCSV